MDNRVITDEQARREP